MIWGYIVILIFMVGDGFEYGWFLLYFIEYGLIV